MRHTETMRVIRAISLVLLVGSAGCKSEDEARPFDVEYDCRETVGCLVGKTPTEAEIDACIANQLEQYESDEELRRAIDRVYASCKHLNACEYVRCSLSGGEDTLDAGNASSGPRCAGEATSCFTQTLRSNCALQQGCAWNQGDGSCLGTPVTCAALYASDDCASQRGCTWGP